MAQGVTAGKRPKRPNVFRRFYDFVTAKHNTSLVFLVALSIGVLMVAVQYDNHPAMTGVFALIWFITFVGLVAQFWGRHQAAQHRLA
ncbi:hypothetical protein [Kitasatospora terrestris]|uniref:Uncharacterized protein n=1 Tax=Kitasatospora terrestris TaxID=258051 RepID=A0ABP9ELD5_9ACTN